MQWRRLGFVAMVVVSAGCTNDGESGAPNTAPIREETSTVVVATEAPATSTSAPVTTAAVPSSVAPVDSVPKPVGEDYRVPVVVKFVPSTDAEREVLSAATELLVKYRRFELTEEKRIEVLREVMVGEALDQWIPNATSDLEIVVVPSKLDRVVVESVVSTGTDSAQVRTCVFDGARLYVRNDRGELVLDNADIGTITRKLQFSRAGDGWRISVDQVVERKIGVDECAD